MTQYGPGSLCQIAVYSPHTQISNPNPTTQSSGDVPCVRTTSSPTPKPDQVEIAPEVENMDIDIPEDK